MKTCQDLIKQYDLKAICCQDCHDKANQGTEALLIAKLPDGCYDLCCSVWDEYIEKEGWG